MTLKQAILNSGIHFLQSEVKKCSSDLEILYLYDRYMIGLQGQILYLTNLPLKEKLRDEFNHLTVSCEFFAIKLKNNLTKPVY